MRGHGGETILLVAECRIARPRQRGLLESAIRERAVNPHEPVGLGKSERPEKERVDRGKEDGVGADADGQRADRESGSNRGI